MHFFTFNLFSVSVLAVVLIWSLSVLKSALDSASPFQCKPPFSLHLLKLSWARARHKTTQNHTLMSTKPHGTKPAYSPETITRCSAMLFQKQVSGEVISKLSNRSRKCARLTHSNTSLSRSDSGGCLTSARSLTQGAFMFSRSRSLLSSVLF